MRCFTPVIAVLAAGAVLAAPAATKAAKPAAKQSAAAKAKAAAQAKAKAAKTKAAAQAKAAKLKAAQAKAAAAKRAAQARAGGQSLASRGAPAMGRPGVPPPDRIGEPFVPTPTPRQPGSQLPVAARGLAGSLLLRTSAEYDPRFDLKPDIVAVRRQGATWEEIDRAIQTWRNNGAAPHQLFSFGLDAGAAYTGGRADGAPHPDDVERDRTGQPLGTPQSPAVLPTAGWLTYLKEGIRRGIDSGVEGIWLGDAPLFAASGHSEAFKKAWSETYSSPWQNPQESPAAYFRASRLKSDLALAGVNDLLRYTRDYSREKTRPVKFLMSLESPLDCAEAGRIFPHAAASRLPLDGIIGQLSLKSARAPLPYQGTSAPHVFESGWLGYSYFANLTEGLADRSLYLSTGASERDSTYAWTDQQSDHQQILAASLLFPQSRGYESCPLPEITHGIGEGSPTPPGYLTVLSNLATAVRDLQGEPLDWRGGTRGVGVLTLDTLMWQRGGPRGSSLSALHGMTLPLLKQGIPVQMVPAERVADPGFLSRYKVLLLSFDMQKPLGPELGQGIADWVRGGGTLILMGGEDPYNKIGEWWERNGYPSPTDHLLRQLGVGVDLPQRSVRQASDTFKEVLRAPVGEASRVHTVSLGTQQEAGKPLFLRIGTSAPTGAVRLGRVRILEGEKVRADFMAGSAAERPFLAEQSETRTEKDARLVDGDGSFVYRFNRLGSDVRLELELGGPALVSAVSGPDPGAALKPALPQFPTLRIPSTYPLVTYPVTGAVPLYTVGDTQSAPAWVSASGQGSVIYCGASPSLGADSAAGGELVRSLVRYACSRAGMEYTEGPIVARRGSFVVAHSLGRTMSLDGQYLDLFKPDFPLVQNPQLPYRQAAFYKQVRLSGKAPTVLFGSHRVRVLESTPTRTRLVLDGPAGSEGFLRIFPAGMSLTGVQAVDLSSRVVRVDVRPDGPTLKVRYPQQAVGINLTLHWVRPEARLTK